jgi:hypothetical protein
MSYFDPRGGANRCKIKTEFFKKWSNEMAYVLGFLYADGDIVDATLSSRTQYIKFTSKDKSILYNIKKLLQSSHTIHFIPSRKRLSNNGKVFKNSRLFYLKIGSKRMFADLKKIGLVPNKSKVIKFPPAVPDRYLNHFVRGYFDGDGCVYLQTAKGKRQKAIIKRLNITFTSGSKSFLQGLNSNLEKFVNLKQNKRIYNSNKAYQLRYSTSDTIKLFKFLYKNTARRIYLERKFKVFLKYFQMCPAKIDKDIKKILHNVK